MNTTNASRPDTTVLNEPVEVGVIQENGDVVVETILLDTADRDLLSDPAMFARLSEWATVIVDERLPLTGVSTGLTTNDEVDTHLITAGICYQDEDWGTDSQGRNVNWLDGLTFLTDQGARVAAWIIGYRHRNATGQDSIQVG